MGGWTTTGFARLSAADRRRVDGLRKLCEANEPLDLKLEIDEVEPAGLPIHFVAEADDELIGYAAITPGDEAEACGMVHPGWRRRGVAGELLALVRNAGRRLERESVLFICEDSGPVALAWMRRLGADDDSAERRMTLRIDTGSRQSWTSGQRPALPLELRRAGGNDRESLFRLLEDGFSGSEEQVSDQLTRSPLEDTLLALDAGEVVGTLRFNTTPRRSMIYGFVIDPKRRGQRLGTRMLAAALDRLRTAGVAEVGLEVDPDNTPAVRLYESFGFETVTTYRYMRLASSPV